MFAKSIISAISTHFKHYSYFIDNEASNIPPRIITTAEQLQEICEQMRIPLKK